MLFIKDVDTTELTEKFMEIWGGVWKEKNFSTERFEQTRKFLVCDKELQPIGTFELSEYQYHPVIERAYPFLKDPAITGLDGKLVYIDKLCIQSSSRGDIDNVGRILYGLAKYSFENEDSKFIALIQPRLYVLIRRVFKLDMQRLGGNKDYEGEYPILFDYLKNKEKILNSSWFKKYQDEELELTKN